jgi:hypothetical protein
MLARGAMFAFGVIAILSISGCDVTGQVLDTIGLAGNIVSVWLQ